MNPILMTVIFFVTLGTFAWSAHRRTRLLLAMGHESDFTLEVPSLVQRVKNLFVYALGQRKMPAGKYRVPGLAHMAIFGAFGVLLLNTLVLWGRAYDPSFTFFGLVDETHVVGKLYSFVKELAAFGAIAGSLVFVYYRVVRHEKRMTLSGEGLAILGVIITMMLGDYMYVAGSHVLAARQIGEAPVWHWYAPFGTALGLAISGLSDHAVWWVEQVGFWWHATWVLLFLNTLPYTKHFHVITALPNVFLEPLTPHGKLPDVEDIEGKLEREEPIGISRIEHLSWKQALDLYTCTECGRCTDNCPAAQTGKMLSPKHFTLALRDHLYDLEDELIGHTGIERPQGLDEKHAELHVHGDPPEGYHRKPERVDLIPMIMDPEVIWGCTSCRACEEVCPVNISYVDKIVAMRQAEVVVKNQFPADLAKAFRAMETNGNPWNLPASDRGGWRGGLAEEGFDVPLLTDHLDAEVVYWVGCAAEYDDRAKKVARSVAKLLSHAGVDFAVTGKEATCTGDPARRAGNEYLFQMLAKQNVETLNGLGVQKKVIITACPHCFNTLKNEYPSFGGKYDVVHHTEFLNGLVAKGVLRPEKPVEAKVAYHDSCYLGRHNGIYDPPREVLAAIPGVQLVEVEYWNRNKGMCCGAGGAQMWKEEEPGRERVNNKRTLQLLDTGASKVATACPFCMTMISDGIQTAEKAEEVENLDVAELLDQSVDYSRPAGKAVSLPMA